MTKVNIKYYSSSLKFCKIAEGKADIYPRLQSINKWDIAAGDAILRAAGGIVSMKMEKKFYTIQLVLKQESFLHFLQKSYGKM